MSGGISKSLHIPDQSGAMVRRTITARYNSDEDQFYVKVPAYLVGNALGWSKSGNGPWEPTHTDSVITGKSPAELFKAVEVAGKLYVKSLEKKVKIIGYDVTFEVGHRVKIDGDWAESRINHDGTSLSISYEIGWRIDINGKETFHRAENGDGYMKEPGHWLEWTEEREKFFADTERALALLAGRFNEFFVDRYDKLAAAIDAHPRTLLIALNKKQNP